MRKLYNKNLLLKKHLANKGVEDLDTRKSVYGWCTSGKYKGVNLQACADTLHDSLLRIEFMTSEIDWEEYHNGQQRI